MAFRQALTRNPVRHEQSIRLGLLIPSDFELPIKGAPTQSYQVRRLERFASVRREGFSHKSWRFWSSTNTHDALLRFLFYHLNQTHSFSFTILLIHDAVQPTVVIPFVLVFDLPAHCLCEDLYDTEFTVHWRWDRRIRGQVYGVWWAEDNSLSQLAILRMVRYRLQDYPYSLY